MFFNIIRRIIKRTSENESSFSPYSDLTPVDDLPKDSEYYNSLDWALKNEKIKNIALAGPYGSGKSSIINSYLKHNKKIGKESIKISMAAFESETSNRSNDKNSTDTLEEGILKQLFYKVNYSKIPQSRYRKIHKISISMIYLYIILTILLIFVFANFFANDIYDSFFTQIFENNNRFSSSPFFSFILFAFLILALSFLISLGVRKILSNAQIKEIKLPTEITIEKTKDPDSIFNKNLDEIMYFFETTKSRFVFFEDFDRFDNSDIFIKLRELNLLLNNAESISNRIVFIYAIRDDLFISDDRTKFFDFIIPVIPIMNSTNAGDILIKKLLDDNSDRKYKISREFLLDISPYINDMRILQNICNEFVLYKKTIQDMQNLNLKDEEMLSMVIFKNLNPKQFAELQAEKGELKELFNSINEIKTRVTNEEREYVSNYGKLLDDIDNDILIAGKEIKISLLYALTDWEGYVNEIHGNLNRTSINQILSDNFDINTLKENDYNRIYYGQFGSSYNEKNKAINRDILVSYLERWNKYIQTKDGQKKDIQNKIEEKEIKIRAINSYSLKQLIDEFGVSSILPPEINNPLIIFLLRRGYINEKYANYINYFKGVSLTNDDMNYILSVKDQKPLPYDYPLTKTNIIISRLQDFEFGFTSIYNHDILEELLCPNVKYKTKLNRMIETLAEDEDAWRFIIDFIERTEKKESFIKLLSCKCTDFWEWVYNNSSLAYEIKLKYLKMILSFADICDIVEQNSEGSISAFITEYPNSIIDLLGQTDNIVLGISKMEKIIDKLNIRFKCQKFERCPQELINYIIEHNNYIINNYMIEEIVKNKSPESLDTIKKQNYTTINRIGFTPLIEYVNNNIVEYMDNVFFSEDNTQEEIEMIINLLTRFISNDEQNTELIKRIINHEEICIPNLQDFIKELDKENDSDVQMIIDQIFTEKKILTTWENVIFYWNEYGYTDTLGRFICTNINEFEYLESNDITDGFIIDLIYHDFDDATLKIILPNSSFVFSDISRYHFNDNKLKLLISLHRIPFTVSNYNSISAISPDISSLFILENQEYFLEYINEVSIKQEQLIVLLNDSKSTHEFKQKLIDKYAYELMDDNLANHILENNYTLSETIFFAVFNIISETEKKNIFLKYYIILDNDHLELCFKELVKFYPRFYDRTKRHKVELEYSEKNIALIKYLKEKEYITSYTITNDRSKIECNIKSKL